MLTGQMLHRLVFLAFLVRASKAINSPVLDACLLEERLNPFYTPAVLAERKFRHVYVAVEIFQVPHELYNVRIVKTLRERVINAVGLAVPVVTVNE